MVHEYDALAARAQHVVAREGADHMLVLVEDGVVVEAAVDEDLAHIVHIVREMEGDQPLRLTEAGDGDALEDEAGHLAGIQGRGDDAGGEIAVDEILGHIHLAEDHAADPGLQGLADDLRLLAADKDAVLIGEACVLKGLGQGNRHLAGDGFGEV